MLHNCPECEKQVSTKALFCPHCGYPFKQEVRKYKSNRKRRLPNGFGQITKINSKNLRKPYRVMVTVGKNEFGRPISKLLKPEAYFETYNEAYQALMKYNSKPYDLSKDMTMSELYDEWSKKYYADRAKTTVEALQNAWKYCSLVYNMDVVNIRIKHVKACINDGVTPDRYTGKPKTATDFVQINIKRLLSLMLDYAVEYELITDNCARAFSMSAPKNKTSHMPYTDDEINILWQHEGEIVADSILVQCYSGWRPQELFQLKKENINLEEHSFTGGMKTESGKNRKVPIHSKIYHIVERLYSQSTTENLIDCKYGTFYYKYNCMLTEYGLSSDHRMHDGRKHFVTIAKKYKVDDFAIKYIVGHTIRDITEKIYTQRELDWLKEEIEKIR